MTFDIAGNLLELTRRAAEEPEPGEDTSKKETYSSWALFILIVLLIAAFFASYFLSLKKVTAVHETVVSIFAGMAVGLGLRVFAVDGLQDLVSFDYQIFFNLLLPPIILSSGYELHQANFFRHIGTILTFAFAGTFLSAVVIGVILWLYTRVPLEGLTMNWIDAISVGATLSATDPVTIIAIFNSYKVDPKLYTIIFGEAILNDAVAIVIFESAQKSARGLTKGSAAGISTFFWGFWIFLRDFFGSLFIGALLGILTALMLKYTYLRRFPKLESCLIVLIAYATYYFSQAIHMSGIVSLLFCGITLKHYAYFNMSRRTQLTTKYMFQVLAQLSENFIFIYLGVSLFTDKDLQFQPLLIIVTVMAVCAARWVAVFPLSWGINWFHRYRAERRGIKNVPEELPYKYQGMLFWAGLRGAVGVALAALLTAKDHRAFKATVLVVVVLTVIIFGGTTVNVLEILEIRTGVTDEIDSDDEFDIEAVGGYYKRPGNGIGYSPAGRNGVVPLDTRPSRRRDSNGGAGGRDTSGWSSGHRSPLSAARPGSLSRTGSIREDAERLDLLGNPGGSTDSDDIGSDIDTSDLPPPAPRRRSSPMPHTGDEDAAGLPAEGSRTRSNTETGGLSATAAIRQLFSTEDPTALFRQLDEDYIKPKLLLDGGAGRGNGGGAGGSS
ncbi:uncharacterized protein PpBr36_06026 [Pyricularia pennisetigena]|uniref:uncharacterized protein n=1 Tax=Pyricularia pennisetigena TaxID=1578925 RepID=UPI00115239FF|nr:uncharacterized protein PpBr36_06026 [Pyricularia pennisetigena]TLS23774.1 hypothetical protein PpBr36_06026 [Pyricularia pennisetigena]